MAIGQTMPGAGSDGGAAAKLTLDAVSGPPLSSIVIAPDKPIVLGRSGQSDAILGDESVSRRHCQVSFRQGTWFIEDLGSRHGTFVQSAKIGQGETLPLKNGDLIGIGPWLLRVRIGSAMPASANQRLVTLMEAPSTTPGQGAGQGPGGTSFIRERVERVHERELAAMNQNRLKLLIDVAAAVAGTSDEQALARTIVRAAVEGTGFPRAFLLRDESVGQGEGAVDTLSVLYEFDPEEGKREAAAPGAPGGAGGAGASPIAPTAPKLPVQTPTPAGTPAVGGAAAASTPMFSRSLIAAARKGEVVRLTGDAPMQAVSIMALGIQTALCAPIQVGPQVGAFLYLDSRSGEQRGPRSAGVIAPAMGGVGVGGTPPVHSDAAAFVSALAKMYALAVGNISRLELEKRQRELVRDLEAAQEAQRLIMPPDRGQIGRVRYAMRSKSGRYVAGDLFDVVDVGGGRVGVLLGDVAGKGVPAAILMATAQTHLHIALRQGGDAAQAVTAVNRHICEHMASNKFISLWIGVFDPAAGMITYVDAGHGYWMITRATETPVRSDSATAGIPLGIDGSFEYQPRTVAMRPGQRLVVFSDGVVEQPGGMGVAGGEGALDQFGFERAMEAVRGSGDECEDVQRLFDAVLAHARGPNLADDTTVASVGIE